MQFLNGSGFRLWKFARNNRRDGEFLDIPCSVAWHLRAFLAVKQELPFFEAKTHVSYLRVSKVVSLHIFVPFEIELQQCSYVVCCPRIIQHKALTLVPDSSLPHLAALAVLLHEQVV